MISLISLKDRKACRKPAMLYSKLDDGTELPALVHSQLMARCIPVFYARRLVYMMACWTVALCPPLLYSTKSECPVAIAQKKRRSIPDRHLFLHSTIYIVLST